MSSIIVFGGTFDPVHVGHIAVAEQALRQTKSDALWFVVTGVPPLRSPAHAPADARLEMLRTAIEGRGPYRALDAEVRRDGVSYTANTMDALHAEAPALDFGLLIGADVARSIQRWHRAADLLSRERFLIVNRAGHATVGDDELRRLGYDPARVTRLEVDSPDVSGSEIRRRLAGGEDVRRMVPAGVLEVIERRGLYRSPGPMHNASG